MGKFKIPIREAPILLLHKNIKVGGNLSWGATSHFFGKAELVKLEVFDR
jgi:hypothetical protein